MSMQLGLDTGGTYTDAVLVSDEFQVLATAKSLTTHTELIQGLRGAVQQVVSADNAADITLVSLSTTLATNALVEGRGRAVALVLIGFDAAQMQRAGLEDALGDDPHVFIVGGHQASGEAIAELDTKALKTFVTTVNDKVDAYAVSSVFAVRNPSHENAAQALINQLTDKPVSCGHHLSSGLDAPRRALTALLNARLIPLISALLSAARALMVEWNINAPLMVVKGDGSLIRDETACASPVETILSGPAASVVGAQFLSNARELLVSDMGGTTTDVALIQDAQPLVNVHGATVGGWRTMVQAVDVRTYGLGGDSAVGFDRGTHRFAISAQRVMPLSLVTFQFPQLLSVLEAQLAEGFSTTHCAQFVMVHDAPATDLTLQQRELYERIQEGPIAVQTLFSDQTLERALLKLEQRGVVLRAGFTPSDAAHLLGQQHDWQIQGARLGATLLMRYASDNLGTVYESDSEFAQEVMSLVSQESAMVLLDSVAASQNKGRGLDEPQKRLLRLGLTPDSNALLSVHSRLHVPVMPLGAPARSYYSACASMLGTELINTEYASVANALGAVVGSVRQKQIITIVPAGGKQVSVLFADGPQSFDTLEQGVAAAQHVAEKLARAKAQSAGATDVTVTHDRQDKVVEQEGQRVFFECQITAMAIGRPSQER